MKSAAATRWLAAVAVCCLCILQAAPVSARARGGESSSALAKPEAPANAGGPPYGPPPDRPALLQPLQYDTKAAPFQSQQKAMALLKEMNQKWEGMEDPIGPNNPWDSVSSHGNQARAFEGPSTKVGTPTDPYTGMFGPWRHPPRAVAPPPMVKTFIFDPNHPFRRQMPEPPNPTNPSSNVSPKLNLWHPITNLTYYDTTKIPRVVMPIPRPVTRRPNYRDPYGVPGRKPQDWLYERIPATPRIVRPQRMGLLRDVPIDHMYPKYHILNPRSAFTRPTHSRGDPLKHSEGFHRFTTRQPEAPKASAAPAPLSSAPRFTTRMPTRPESAEELFAPSRFPPPPNAHPLRMPPQADLSIDPSSLIEQNARVLRRKAASSSGERASTRMARALRPTPRRMGPPLPKDIDRVEREEALVELNEKLALSAALRSKLKHGKPLMVNAATVTHKAPLLAAEMEPSAPSLMEEQASVTDRDELTASAAVKVGTAADAAATVSVETDVVSRPANEVRPASAPALLQYEVALVPKQGPPAPEQQAAPSSVSAQPDQTQLTLAEIGARLSLQQEAADRTKAAIASSKTSPQEAVFTETEAKITAEAGAETEVDEGAQDLVAQHQQRVQKEQQEEEQRKAAAWEASPASKVAWWDRPESLKENEERASKFVEVGSSVDNRDAPNFAPSSDQVAIGQTDPSFATPAGPSALMELSSSSSSPAPSPPSFLESQSLSASQLASVSASNSLNAYSAPDFRTYQHAEEATPSAPSPAAQAPVAQSGFPSNAPFAMPQQPAQPPMFLQQAASAAYPLANNAIPSPATYNANQPISLANLPPQVTALLAHSQTLTPAQPTNIFIVQPPSSQQSDFSVRQERSLPPIVLA